MSGKGSTPRPIPNRDQFTANWDAIYAKPKVETTESIGKKTPSKVAPKLL